MRESKAQQLLQNIAEYYGGDYEPQYQHSPYGGGQGMPMQHHMYHPSASYHHEEPSYTHSEEPAKKPKSRTKAFLGGVALGAAGVVGASTALAAGSGA